MQHDKQKRRQLIIILSIIGLFVGVSLVAAFFLRGDPENQFGKFIPIKNFTSEVKDAPQATREATESSLYNIVSANKNGQDFNPARIDDALIRSSSVKQATDHKTDVTSGNYIVDIESIKQSYKVQYSFSKTESNVNLSGSPVVITCPLESDLIYGTFTCTDFVQAQTSKNDTLLQHLPYQSFSFKITPDATRGETLTLVVDMTIPQIDLKGSESSRREVVSLYKNEVLLWIQSKGAKPEDYSIVYNYDDVGNLKPAPKDYSH